MALHSMGHAPATDSDAEVSEHKVIRGVEKLHSGRAPGQMPCMLSF
jgi:hypothetical protein